ncbi:hypothetical protein IV38_GL000210 [Lactobacillus selangorensis]|uniref:Sugar specific permease n=1 Tax=Lactobacillus selangorensis TaxID=81857 RepID=A0A0R2FL17_9LACO|nr:hypothetical protein [Lactobacillus selangorensis]KRN29327.1 hypothetical protein IV38_GL000210 [Lactobacillus selangorensis]KRN34144.1 hypothetical protein IV40_GL000459 [Lactobacillus selangorensis]
MIQQKSIPLSRQAAVTYFIISLLLNTFGNGLTVALNLGSALWTASAVNLMHLIHLNLFTILMLYGILVVIANALLLEQLDWTRMVGNFIFMLPYSYLVGLFTHLLLQTPINSLPLWLKVILDLFGISLVAIAISIYQRVNWVLHPNDDLMQIIRFKFCHGRAALAMWLSIVPPVVIMVFCWLLDHQLYAVNIGTLVALFFQGAIIGWSDRHVFPALKHQGLNKIEN